MVDTRAFASYWTMYHDHQFRNDDLKLCFLWNDEILFETLKNDVEKVFFDKLLEHDSLSKKDIHSLTDILIPLRNKVGESTIYPHGWLYEPDHRYPRFGKNHEFYHYPEPQNAQEFAHNKLLKKIEAEYDEQKVDRSFCEPLEGRARSATLAVQLWERVNVEYPCIMQSTADEALTIQSFHEFRYPSSKIIDPYSLFQMVVPSLEKVPWHDVIELRKKGGFDILRSKIGEALEFSPDNIINAKKIFETFESDVINEIIEQHRPKIKKIALESVLANIPGIPFINPAGIYLGIRDVNKQIKNFQNSNWFYLLRDIKRLNNGG